MKGDQLSIHISSITEKVSTQDLYSGELGSHFSRDKSLGVVEEIFY